MTVLTGFHFCFSCYGDHRDLHVLTHSVPTQLSSDLWQDGDLRGPRSSTGPFLDVVADARVDVDRGQLRGQREDEVQVVAVGRARPAPVELVEAGDHRGEVVEVVDRLLQRSDEHTSELQSLMRISYAVFCLKKKQITI